MEFQPSPAFLGLNILGGIIKNFIPTKKVNKAIPVINYLTAFGVRKAMGMTWSGAAVSALYESGAAMAVHKGVKEPVKAITGKSI